MLKNLEKSLFNQAFSHIYVEKEVMNHPVAQRILSRFPKAVRIEITHYKDVFCRSHQNYRLQKLAPSLILAGKHQNLVYEGAPVCQDFGNQHFYYTSSVMNCIYDCEYCYLQGMYPSANLVIFVNLEDILEEVRQLLEKHPVYLCISYDTDLLALESILGYVKEWISFAAKYEALTIEIRTKSANIQVLDQLQPTDNVIFAWTLSPEQITAYYEHHTPSLFQRLACIEKAIKKGFKVRLCFDPMLYTNNWMEQYQNMIDTVFKKVQGDLIQDVSIGVFRVSQDYMKKMRKQAGDSAIIQFPFENDNGVYHYNKELSREMISFAYECISREVPEDKIFLWEEAGS